MQGELTLIWAYGQEDTFYRADHLKYHGRKNRGVASLGKGHCIVPVNSLCFAISEIES